MSSELGIKAVTKKAEEQEKRFDWLEAARSYEQALHFESLPVSFAAETWERIGFCYSRASAQTGDIEEFKKLRQLAVEAYKSAAKLFEKEDSLKNHGKSAQCNAMAEYVLSWLASSPSEKRKMLDECRLLGNKSLKAYENAGDELSYGKMCNDLLLCLLERLYVASDWREMRNIAQEGIDCADKAIAVLSKLGNKSELLRAYFTASLQSWYAHACMEKRKELMRRSLSYSKKALKLSREVVNPYYAAMSNWAAAFCNLLFTEKVESALEYAKEMLKQGMIVKDNYLKGVASYVLAFVTNWMILREGDPDRRKEGHEKIIKQAEDAIRYLQLVSQDFFIAETYLFYADARAHAARDVVTSLEDKRAMLEKALEIGHKGLEHATRSGSLDATGSALHALSKALHFYSNLETEEDEKTKLLEKALIHRKEYINIAERLYPSNDWMHGVGKNYEGLIRADLARVETDKIKKRAVLESAVSDMEYGVSRCGKWLLSHHVPTLLAAVARFEDWFGGILNELYLLTEDKEILSRANEVYEDASKKFKEVNLPSRLAETYWKMARNQDCLGEYLQATTNFENAFAAYKVTAQKIPHFVDFYLDYAVYMKAWSEIETAKFAHKNGEYATAIKHYEKTANLLKQSKLWSYLSSNFLAWSLLEQAEDLSRKESSTESIETFKKATELFREAKRTLRAELDKIENADEKNLAERLIKASDTRAKYCLGRIAVEEAKILDRQGDHTASSKKYGSAAETFQKMAKVESKQTRKELEPLIYLCQAWQKMMMAEARASPIMYEEAAELFKQAKEHTLDQPTSLLALANSSFCLALEAGTEFEITRDMTMYSTTIKHMEAAANYYLKAGFKTASEYAKATQRLFDAYVYMDNAKRETDPEKEARYYTMAEKVLQTAAGSYTKAKHPEKAEQVQRLLEKVGEERKLAVSLSEVLHAPTITSSTASFVTLTPSEEMAVGLERFEHADVQAKLIQHQKEIRVGEDFNLKMQIVNVGKEPVLLAKVEEILPAGFQLVAKPDYCHFEDAYLDMNGKRLDPLKTEEIGLVLRPFEKGTFEMRPRIVCVDETGHQMLRGPEPVTITVSEVVLPGRITIGYEDLDSLLFGGIPENYAVILTSPSCDERDMLIKRFLEAGAKEGQITFYVTLEASGVRAFAEKFQSNFYVFICNPRADTMIKNLPNVFKLKGVENLTDIDIALTNFFRRLDEPLSGPRRACIEIVSDVLLQHHAVTTRRWLTGLIPDLRSKGFTTLAVINPLMHPPEQVHAILGLFEGEISIYEKETKKGLEKFLKVKKMYNQRYVESELSLRKERLET
jgi:KaiC/GvpD/RAD55 family RecA-like ATPase/tetratricopeptide (TPR) repeat protein